MKARAMLASGSRQQAAGSRQKIKQCQKKAKRPMHPKMMGLLVS